MAHLGKGVRKTVLHHPGIFFEQQIAAGRFRVDQVAEITFEHDVRPDLKLAGAHEGKGVRLALAACRTTDIVDANHHIIFPRHDFLDYRFHNMHSFAALLSCAALR